MPLLEKARIEVYLPDVPRKPAYRDLLVALQQEFTHSFGGCTLTGDLEGAYVFGSGQIERDHIRVLYTDADFAFSASFDLLGDYFSED